jgi:hypothetical protein
MKLKSGTFLAYASGYDVPVAPRIQDLTQHRGFFPAQLLAMPSEVGALFL